MVIAAVLLAGTASSAVAAGPYVGAAFGPSIFHDADLDRNYGGTDTLSYDTGIAVNAVGGYNFDGFRLEGEYGYRHADVDKVSGYSANNMDTGIHSAMANVFYDFLPARMVTPVVGAGFGALFGVFGDRWGTYHDTKPGYQATVGMAVKTGRFNIDVYYRLQGSIGDFDVATSKVSYLNSSILTGGRFNF